MTKTEALRRIRRARRERGYGRGYGIRALPEESECDYVASSSEELAEIAVDPDWTLDGDPPSGLWYVYVHALIGSEQDGIVDGFVIDLRHTTNQQRNTMQPTTFSELAPNPTSGPLSPGDRVEDIDDNSGNPTGYRGVVVSDGCSLYVLLNNFIHGFSQDVAKNIIPIRENDGWNWVKTS